MAVLETTLRGLKGRLVALWTLRAALTAGVYWLSFLAGLALLDTVAVLPYPARLGAALAATAAAAAWFAREGLLSAVRRTSETGLALYLERCYPQFKDALVTAYQFLRQGAANADFNSPALVREAVAAGEAAAARVEAREVLQARRSRRLAAGCAGIVAVSALLAFASPRFATALTRLVADVPFPRRTFYRVASPAATAVKVPRGENLLVRIVPEGETHRPGRATVSYAFGGDGDPIHQGMNRFESGDFSWEFEGVTEHFTFTLRADDWTAGPYAVTVVERPRLEELALEVVPPAYTGLPPRAVLARGGGGAAAGSGDIQAFRGTRVSFRGRANKPLARASLFLGENALPVSLSQDAFQGSFEIQEGGVYHFALVDAEGFEEDQPTRYQIRLLPDRPPQVRIAFPEEGTLDVTPFARFDVKTIAQDDLGLSAVRLLYSTTESDETWLPIHDFFSTAPPPEAPPAPDHAGAFVFEMEQLKAQPGLLVRYRVEASDFNTPPGVSFSQEYRCRVKEPSEVSQEVTRRLDDLRQETERCLARQMDLRQQVTRVLDVGEDAEASRQSLIQAALAQQGMVEDLAARRRFLEKTIWYFDINRLGEPVGEFSRAILEQETQRRQMLSRIAAQFDALVTTTVPGAARVLKEAHDADDRSEAAVNRALAAQGRVADDIQKILDELRRVSDISSLINTLRQVKENLRRVAQ